MASRLNRLSELVASGVEALGYEFVGVELDTGGGRRVLRVYIDHPDGITLGDCERVSHQVSGVLDVEDPIQGNYLLEVSSPGVERPLFEAEHYERFIGARVRVKLHDPLHGRRKIKGVIVACGQGMVTLDEDGEVWEIPLADISRANLVAEV
ncbi:MAG: ribosome maturation factor RimP [Gammaproteobacteria bacterium]|nr:ribosome maturation factor RimP [Gammaproteobacteria bacterium]